MLAEGVENELVNVSLMNYEVDDLMDRISNLSTKFNTSENPLDAVKRGLRVSEWRQINRLVDQGSIDVDSVDSLAELLSVWQKKLSALQEIIITLPF